MLQHSPQLLCLSIIKIGQHISQHIIYKFIIHELNQIGIKIDMYRQEYRFTPAFAFIQAV